MGGPLSLEDGGLLESPPKAPVRTPRELGPESNTKLAAVGDAIVSFSSSSMTFCMPPDWSLLEPKGFEFAPKGLVKPGLDIFLEEAGIPASLKIEVATEEYSESKSGE